jgi:hypothetical protein
LPRVVHPKKSLIVRSLIGGAIKKRIAIFTSPAPTGHLVGLVAAGHPWSDILAAYLEEEDIRQALEYAPS